MPPWRRSEGAEARMRAGRAEPDHGPTAACLERRDADGPTYDVADRSCLQRTSLNHRNEMAVAAMNTRIAKQVLGRPTARNTSATIASTSPAIRPPTQTMAPARYRPSFAVEMASSWS